MGSAAQRRGAYGGEISVGLRQAAAVGGGVEEGGRRLGFWGEHTKSGHGQPSPAQNFWAWASFL
jgi:hypothetical protein